MNIKVLCRENDFLFAKFSFRLEALHKESRILTTLEQLSRIEVEKRVRSLGKKTYEILGPQIEIQL